MVKRVDYSEFLDDLDPVEVTYRKWAKEGPPSDIELVQAWVCDQPRHGLPIRVVRDEWIDQGNRLIRLIFEIVIA
jgi:hypothetical protein